MLASARALFRSMTSNPAPDGTPRELYFGGAPEPGTVPASASPVIRREIGTMTGAPAATSGGTADATTSSSGSPVLTAKQIDELTEKVVDRLEQRVVDELERRGRRMERGAF